MTLQSTKRERQEDDYSGEMNQHEVSQDTKRPKRDLQTLSNGFNTMEDTPELVSADFNRTIANRNQEALTSMGLRNVQQAISGLDDDQICSIITQLANEHPAVAGVILSNYRVVWEKECAEIIDFNVYSANLWHDINESRGYIWDPEDIKQPYVVAEEVRETITQDIIERVKSHSNFATKKSALETLRKVGKSVCLGMGEVADEVRNSFFHSSDLDSGIIKILESMDREHKAMMADAEDGQYLQKLDELEGLAEKNRIFKSLGKAAKLIRKAQQPQDEETGSEGSEELSE